MSCVLFTPALDSLITSDFRLGSMKGLRLKGLRLTVGGLLALFLLAGAYFSLRYTVVAGTLESFASVDQRNFLVVYLGE